MNARTLYGWALLFAAAVAAAWLTGCANGLGQKPAARGTLTDARDGKTYRTVKIGDHTWMAENLNYQPAAGGSWCYDDDSSKCGKYGRLYDWKTAANVCPTGWHLSANQEWDSLVAAAGDNCAGGKRLKSKNGWSDGGNGIDYYGFSARPGGHRSYKDDGLYGAVGNAGEWWAADGRDDGRARSLLILYSGPCAYIDNYSEKGDGRSVRCVMDEYRTLTLNAGSGGSVSGNPGKTSYMAGEQVSISAAPDSGFSFVKWTGGKVSRATSAATTVTVFSNTALAAEFEPLVFGTLSDSRDGKSYKTVKIGGKTWMAENLNYASGSSWCYEDSGSYCDEYGRLYSWKAAKRACPAGWGLPSRRDWNNLIWSAGWDSAAGKKLKAASGWGDGDGRGGEDSYGFSALPGGMRNCRLGRCFRLVGEQGRWWTATEYEYESAAYYRAMTVRDTEETDKAAFEDFYEKDVGYSVRCVMEDD